jgi:hypothetical protein
MRLFSDRRHHAATSGHASFPFSQDGIATSTSSSGIVLSHHLPSRAKTEALNLHHHRRLPFSDRPSPTLNCYKKIISILVTLSITQSRLYFTSSLARASRHRSFIHRRCSPSPPSHIHHPSVQWHPWWWTRHPSFTSRTAYQHVNLRKKIF